MKEIVLNYKEFGEGTPVIILHGFLGMLDNWKTFGRKLSENYKVYLVDQRDHGKSPHTEDFNYTLLANDLAAFMDQHQIEKAHILGHSMGGKTVMKFTQLHEEKVLSTVVVDIAPKAYNNHHTDILDALHSITPKDIADRQDADDALSKHISDWGVRQFLMKNLTRNPEGGFRWKMNLQLLTEKYDSIIQPVDHEKSDVRCIFINGAKSNYIVEEDKPEILKVFSNASFHTIQDAGHWVHAEQGVELLAVVNKFLEGA